MLNILIVDDDVTFVQTCAQMLRRADYMVREACSAYAAIEQLKKERPDAMLLDWKLPDGTALDVLQWAVARNYEVPTALVTGFWSDAGFDLILAEVHRLGVSECLRRGMDFEEPEEIVRRLVDPLLMSHRDIGAGISRSADALARELPPVIIRRLRKRFPKTDEDLVGGAVLEAIARYLREPLRFRSSHISVERVAYTLARRAVWNALRAERRRRSREVEYARMQGEIAEPDDRQESPSRALIEQALRREPDAAARSALRAWLDGERGTELWLAVPAIRVLSPADRRAAVDRLKDALRARVKRLGKRPRTSS